MNFDIRSRTILLAVGGSRAYGMHRSDSDVDVKGVCIPTGEYLHGYLHRFEQADKPEHVAKFADLLSPAEREIVRATKLEGTVFSLQKFVGLVVENNPNCLDPLHCREEEVRLLTPLGKKLRDNRGMFLSARAKHSFSGYSAAQLKRIRGHRAWLLNPPDHQPTRGEFGLPENTLLPADHLAAVRAAVQKQLDLWQFDFAGMANTEKVRVENLIAEHLTDIRTTLGYDSTEDARYMAASRHIGLDDNLIHVMQKEREYEGAARRWKQYTEWKTNRNADRAKMEEESGFDRKHAAHLVRLLKMCREIMTTGKVHVWRGPSSEPGAPQDWEELLAIRNGEKTYDEIVEWAENEDKELDVLYHTKAYVVPHQSDREAVDKLCVSLVEEALSGGR